MTDLDQLKLRTTAKFLELVADEMLEPATIDINDVFVDNNGILRTYLKGIPLVPERKLAMVEFSIEDYLHFEYEGTEYDTVQDIQDAYFQTYGLDTEDIEAIVNDQSFVTSKRSFASLMLVRDSLSPIHSCVNCGFYYEEREHGKVCPYCGRNHHDVPANVADEYGRIVS